MKSDYLELTNWNYARHFSVPPFSEVLHPVIEEVESYVRQRQLESHKFFTIAHASKEALRLWVSQELVMTNAFSQIVLRAASYVSNVHVRAVLTEVAFGEHGVYRRGVAKKSHPYLLDQLRVSLGVEESDVSPTQPCLDFLEGLAAKCSDTLVAIAAIGVGNERLIIPEYTGIQEAFDDIWPESNYRPFLKANIDEDVGHTRLCYQAAGLIMQSGADAERYRLAAIDSVEARWAYFDGLVSLLEGGQNFSGKCRIG